MPWPPGRSLREGSHDGLLDRLRRAARGETTMTTETQQVRERVLAAVDARRDEIAETLSQVIRIESVNPKYPGQVYDEVVGREGDASKVMAQIYRSIGAEVDVFAVEPGRENAVGVVRGSGGGRSLIYNGHVDVVPTGPAGAWRFGGPWSGCIADGRLYGRGACDMKGGVLAQAIAARAIVESGVRLRGDLILE